MRAAMIMAITASAVVGRSAGGPPGGDASKVAIVGNRTVTRAELEERVRPKLIQIENQRYEALSDGARPSSTSSRRRTRRRWRCVRP